MNKSPANPRWIELGTFLIISGAAKASGTRRWKALGMQSLSSLESSSTQGTLGTTWLIHREEKTLCQLSEVEQSII